MGRSSKFSFSLSSRKGSIAEIPKGKGDPQWGSSGARQPSGNMDKVARLLGTTDLPVRPSPSYDTLERASLSSKQPSYVALTVSEGSGGDLGRLYAESTGTGRQHRPPRNQILHHKASSSLLGQSGHFTGHMYDSSASANTRDLRSEQSSTTLQSYYEAHKVPLVVSQQTSDSAVRDGALRKGLDPVVRDPRHTDGHARSYDARMRRQHDATPSSASTTFGDRQRRTETPTTFARPRTSSGDALGSRGTLGSPSQYSLVSELPSQRRQFSSPDPPALKSPRTRTVLHKPLPESSRMSSRPSNASSLRRDEPYDNPKNNVRRPPQGIKNWFDGLLEEMDEEYETDEDADSLEWQQPTQATITSSPSTPSTVTEAPVEPPTGSRYFNSSAGFDQPGPGNHHRNLNPLRSHPPENKFRASSVLRNIVDDGEAKFGASDTSDEFPSRATSLSEVSPPAPPHQRPVPESPSSQASYLQPQDTTTGSLQRHSLASYYTATSENSRANRLTQVDLRHSSALSMSSSSPSDGEEDEHESPDFDPHVPQIRDSIAISEISADNVMIARARAYEIRLPERRMNDPKRSARPVHLRALLPSDIVEELPPEPRSAGPTTTVAPDDQKLPSLSRSADEEEPVRPHTSAADVRSLNRTSGATAAHGADPLPAADAATPGLGHKLMSVTPEEEALLEMMRSKRVAMAEHNFQEGYKTALRQEEWKKLSLSPGMDHESLLAAVEAVVQAAAAKRQSESLEASQQKRADLSHEPPAENGPADAEATITAESTLTEIMDAFPAPSPTSNRFSTTFATKAENRNSAGISATSSSRQGRAKRHSNLSAVSSSVEGTAGTSATSTSPIAKQQASNADKEPDSGELSTASTERASEASNKLPSAPTDASQDGSPAAGGSSLPATSPVARPATTPGEQEHEHFGELTIGASESIVGNNDTDDLSSPHLHEEVPTALATPAQTTTQLPPDDSTGGKAVKTDKADKRRSMRIDVSADPPSRPPSFAAPESPRKLPEKRISRGTEYRLIPRIPQASPISATFPPHVSAQLPHAGRSVSSPGTFDSSADLPGRPAMPSAHSAPQPGAAGAAVEQGTAERRAKPRAINIASVKRAFSVQRDPGPQTAPLPRDSVDAERMSKRFSKSSLSQGDPERLSKRFSMASLHSEGERLSKRFSKASLHGRSFEAGQRSSVSEDVLNAWTNLGGWRGLESLRGAS